MGDGGHGIALGDDERIALIGSEFRVWKWACLRSAGFPASLVLRLGATAASAAADAVLVAEEAKDRARLQALSALRAAHGSNPVARDAFRAVVKGRVPEANTGTPADEQLRAWRHANARLSEVTPAFDEAFAIDRVKVFRAAQEIAADPKIREAVTWQNRAVVSRALDVLVHADPKAIRQSSRSKEALVASYLQRYTVKNDSIGFFGPIGWARLSAEGDAAVIRPGRDLVDARFIYFEHWGIDAIAVKHSADASLEPWMVARRHAFVRVDGAVAHSAMDGRHALTDAEATVLRAVDARRTARELAAELVAEHARLFPRGELDVFDVLRALRARKLLAWAFEVPLVFGAETHLRRTLERIEDETLRSRALAPLDALEAHRQELLAATGDEAALGRAYDALAATFSEATGSDATHRAGAMYAGRQLVVEECHRAVDATFGPKVIEALGPPLSLLLMSARWLTFEIAKTYGEALRAIFDALAKRAENRPVLFSDLWFRTQRLFFGTERPVDEISRRLKERWAEIFVCPEDARRVEWTAAELLPRVRAAFAAPGPGWSLARHQSPDVMIAAKDVEAIRRGDFQLVLGELHAGSFTIDYPSFVAHHPRPQELFAAYEADLPDPLVFYGFEKEKWTVGTTRVFFPAWFSNIETGFDPAPGPRERVFSMSDLVVEEHDGKLFLRLGDGTEPKRIPLLDVFGATLSWLSERAFGLMPARPHTPRITIDRMVVTRETWRFPVDALDFATAEDEKERFLAVRRWARAAGLPRFVFVKFAFEVKPMFLDLDSPALINVFTKLARTARQHPDAAPVVVSEMVPCFDDLWLTDSSDSRFTAELRMVAVDIQPAR